MLKFIYKNAGKTTSRPEVPVMSRFVSPWDTSGWYSVLPDFDVGSRVYSNTEDTVASCPQKYRGAEYIMTFNSNAEGFDDKQEVDFYVERDAVVSVCLDAGAPLPEWAAEYKSTGDEVTLSSGAKYVIIEKGFKSGEQVHIPGLVGDGNHFFVLAQAKKPHENAPLASAEAPKKRLGTYKKKTYKSYVNEVFNFADSLGAFDVSENVTLEKDCADARNMFVKISGRGRLEKRLDGAGDRIVCSAEVTPVGDGGIYAVCAFVSEKNENVCGVFIDGGKIKAVTSTVSETLETIAYGEKYLVKVIYDSKRGECDVWLNSRRAARGIPIKNKATHVGFYATDGEMHIDNLKIYDDTEVFVADESGATLDEEHFILSENAALSRRHVPMKSRPSMTLSSRGGDASAVYPFPKISCVGSVETKVRPSDRNIAKISLMSSGGEAASVALYMNSLFVSNGDEWKQVYAGETDWAYYPTNNFFYIKLTFDTERGTYDVWVDGACRARGMKTKAARDICGVGYTVGGKTKLYIGKIRVYDDADLCRGVIPAGRVFDVTKAPYNAKGDGKTLDTAAIQAALDDAAYTGGTVLIKGGTFLSGELMLRTDETVFVAPDATILGTQDHGEYPLVEPRTSLCAHRQLGRGLLYGENISNITVTGGGMLDGNGRYRFKMNDPVNDHRALDARPDIVYITYSNNITVENINFKSSAFWTVVPLSSGNVTLKNLNLDCMNTPNRDGIDPVDCHDMTVENCCVMAGDDGLCFKSSDPVGCYNIDVRDMMIQSLASGIKFGTDTYYCLMNARISDCTVKNVNRCGVSLETVDGALVKGVTFERIDMTDVGAPVYITVGARNRLPRGIDKVRSSRIDGVLFCDIVFEDAYPFSYTKDIREVIACGQSETQMIENVTFENCRFDLCGGFDFVPERPTPIDAKYPEYDRHGLSAGHAFTVRFAKNFKIRNCKVKLKSPDVRPFVAFFDTDEQI